MTSDHPVPLVLYREFPVVQEKVTFWPAVAAQRTNSRVPLPDVHRPRGLLIWLSALSTVGLLLSLRHGALTSAVDECCRWRAPMHKDETILRRSSSVDDMTDDMPGCFFVLLAPLTDGHCGFIWFSKTVANVFRVMSKGAPWRTCCASRFSPCRRDRRPCFVKWQCSSMSREYERERPCRTHLLKVCVWKHSRWMSPLESLT